MKPTEHVLRPTELFLTSMITTRDFAASTLARLATRGIAIVGLRGSHGSRRYTCRRGEVSAPLTFLEVTRLSWGLKAGAHVVSEASP